MILEKIKIQFAQTEKRKILNNFFSLTALQLSNYIIPLMTLPYLTRVLGPEKYGLTAFAQAFIQYFILITDFGFNLSATREIAINRESDEKVSRIFSSVITIKIFLLILSFFTLIIIIFNVPKFSADSDLYYLTFLSVIGSTLFPQWFYQGIEKMKFIAIFSVSAKAFFTLGIFIFIKEPGDYLWLPILNSLGFIVSGLIGVLFPFLFLGVKYITPNYQEIKYQFKEGWHIFISTVSINLYTTSNTVLLGIFTNNVIVGYYTAAERIFRAVQFLGMPIYQAIFPHFSKLIIEDKNRAISQFNRMFRYTMIITFIISGILSIGSHYFILNIIGSGYEPSVLIFSVLSWVIFVSWGNYTLGIQGMVNFGYKEVFSKIVVIFGLVHIIVATILINNCSFISVAFVWLFTESAIFSYEYYFLKKHKILI